MADTKLIQPQTETEKLFALDKPSLENLSYCLRHPETWPSGFHWDFKQCSTCAMGLARALWDEKIRFDHSGTDANEKAASVVARAFALPYSVANDIFMGQGDWAPKIAKTKGRLWWKVEIESREINFRAVMPEMVADQIDSHLASAR